MKVLAARTITTTMIATSSSHVLLNSYRHLRKRSAQLYCDLEQNEEQLKEQSILESELKSTQPSERESCELKQRQQQQQQQQQQQHQQDWQEVSSNWEEKERFTKSTMTNDAFSKKTLSLDRIRAEMQAMYNEMYNKDNVPVRTPLRLISTKLNDECKGNNMKRKEEEKISADVLIDKKDNAQSVDEELLAELESRFRRSAKYYNGEDVHAQVTAQRTRLRRMLINDAEDVLRCKDKRNVLKYLHYSGVYSSFDDKSELYALVNRVRELVSETKTELHITIAEQDKESNELSDYHAASITDISRLSWIKTLCSLSHHEIRLLWQNGLLDAEILQELLVEDVKKCSNDKDDDDRNVVNTAELLETTENELADLYEFASNNYMNSNISNNISRSQKFTNQHLFPNDRVASSLKQEQFANNKIKELNADNLSATATPSTTTTIEMNKFTNLLIDDEFDKFEQIRHMSELAREITNYTLHPTISAPTLELATVLEKTHEGQMRDITLEELLNLEQYEKGKVQLNVSLPTTTSLSSSLSSTSSTLGHKKHCSLSELSNSKNTEISHELGNSVHANHSKKITTTEMNLDKSLAPANYFVYAVAQHDKVLWESLRALEQIRREVLLDSDFQQAVQLSQSMDANSFFTPEQFGEIFRHRHGKAKLAQNDSNESKIKNEENNDDDDANDYEKDDMLQSSREYIKLSKREELFKQHKQNASPHTMLTRPHNAADVPYFYGSIRSVIPPKAKYNLPAPALSAHEKRVLFSKMRQQSKKRKFTS